MTNTKMITYTPKNNGIVESVPFWPEHFSVSEDTPGNWWVWDLREGRCHAHNQISEEAAIKSVIDSLLRDCGMYKGRAQRAELLLTEQEL